jgi:HNH endonuclease
MTVTERLFALSIPEPNSGCWLWLAAVAPNGYGKICITANRAKQSIGAHRVSYETFNGAIPPNLLVLHRCDNRACINPDHLFVGTQKDNVDDMNKKGRHPHPFKASCKNGHPFIEETSNLRGVGNARRCLICARLSYKKYYQKRKGLWAIR